MELEHHGVKGMHWGIRNDPKWQSRKATAKKVGSTGVKVAKVVGRGGKKTYEVAKTHPRTTGAVVALVGYHFIFSRKPTLRLKSSVIKNTAIAYAGARFAQSRIDKHKKQKWNELNMPEDYIQHYGVKGMKWATTQEQIHDRIFRVETGTTLTRERIEKARKIKLKDILEEEETDIKPKTLPPEEDISEEETENLLGKVGGILLVET